MREKFQIKHVLFDLDGLLINSEKIYTERLSEYLAKHGKVFTYKAKCLMMGRKPLEAAEALKQEYSLPMSTEEVLEDYRRELPLEIWHTVSLMPGARKLVEYLSRSSIEMAIATGSSSNQVPHKLWEFKDLWQKIHHVVAAGDDPEVKHGKPAPDVFEVALARFNDPSAKAETTLVFEDAWNGVKAALAAGMYVVWVPDEDECPGLPHDAPPVITDSNGIPRIIRLKSLEEFDPSVYGLPLPF
nr:haloacid dehalogenase hydrolase [Hymenolepis microstoma]